MITIPWQGALGIAFGIAAVVLAAWLVGDHHGRADWRDRFGALRADDTLDHHDDVALALVPPAAPATPTWGGVPLSPRSHESTARVGMRDAAMRMHREDEKVRHEIADEVTGVVARAGWVQP